MTARAVFVRITFWSSLIAMVGGRVVVSATEAQTRRMIVADTGNVLIPVITVAGEQSVHMLTAVRFPPPALFFANPNKNWTIDDFEKPKQSTSYAVTDDMSDQDQFSEEEKLPEEDPLPEINKRPEQSTLSINNQPSDKDERPEKGPLPEKNQPSEQDKQPEQNKLSEKDQATEKVQPLEKEPEREKLSDKDQKPEKNQLPVKDQPSKQVEQPEHSKVSEKDQPSEKEPEQDKLSDKDQRPEKNPLPEKSQPSEKGPGQDSLSEKDQIPETGPPPDESKVSEKNQPSEKKQDQEKPSDTDQRPEKGPFPEEQDNLPEVSVQDEVQLETTVTTAGPGAEEKRKTEAEKGDGLQQTTGVREREETTTVDSRNEHTSDRRPSLADLLHSATGGGGWFGKRQTFPGDRRPSARPAAADTGRPQQQQQTIILTSRPLPWPTADVDYLLVKRHG